MESQSQSWKSKEEQLVGRLEFLLLFQMTGSTTTSHGSVLHLGSKQTIKKNHD